MINFLRTSKFIITVTLFFSVFTIYNSANAQSMGMYTPPTASVQVNPNNIDDYISFYADGRLDDQLKTDAGGILEDSNRVYQKAIDAGRTPQEAEDLRYKVKVAGLSYLKEKGNVMYPGMAEGALAFADELKDFLLPNVAFLLPDFSSDSNVKERVAAQEKLTAAYNNKLASIKRSVGDETGALARENQAKRNEINAQKTMADSDVVVCSLYYPLQTTLLGCVAIGAYNLLSVFVWIFGLIAMLFNYVITYTLNMSSLVSKITIVDIGWTAIRDIINLSFIFLVLYAAINTIIGNSDYGIKKMLSKIIIAAVLINFSLFFTQVMIDVSNVFALTFYNKITNNVGVSSSTSVSGISATISHAIGIDSLLTWSQKGANSVNLDALSIIEYSIGSIIFLCITIFVLGAGALMLIARALTLIFLMMTSPIAFISGVLPQAKDVAGKWWKSLTANLMFAPMYMAFIYLVVLMATNLNGKYNLIDVFSDKGDWEKVLATLFNMIILNGMMAASLGVAISMGDSSTKTAVGWAKGWANKGRDWISAKATNNTIGRVAAGISTNQGLQRMVARGGALGMVGTGILKSSRFASTGFTKAVDAAEKRKLEFNNSLSKEKVVTDKAERDAQGNFIEDLSSDTFGEINGVRTRIKMKKLDSAREIMLKTSVRRGESRFSSRATRKVAAQAQIDKNKDDIEDEQKKRNELNEQRKVIDDQISIWNKTNVGQPTDPTLLAKKQEISDEIGKINKKIKELQNDNGVKRAKIVTARGGANRLGSSSIRV